MKACERCRDEYSVAENDVNICDNCWDKILEQITVNTYPCTDASCVFTHPGGMCTNGGCSCLQDFPMSKAVRRRLTYEIRMSNIRATKKGHRQAVSWLERAIRDKVWESEDGIEAGLKYMLACMGREL
jgi:hypothetical protein